MAKLVKSAAGLGLDGLINEHERDYRAIRLEWAGLVDASLYSCGALDLMKNILKGLIVHPDRISRNLDSSACLISTEALMFMIGDKIGKQAAHQLLYEISMEAHTSGIPLSKLLIKHPLISSSFTEQDIEEAVDPSAHIGTAVEQADKVVATANIWLANHQTENNQPSSCLLAVKDHGCMVDQQSEDT